MTFTSNLGGFLEELAERVRQGERPGWLRSMQVEVPVGYRRNEALGLDAVVTVRLPREFVLAEHDGWVELRYPVTRALDGAEQERARRLARALTPERLQMLLGARSYRRAQEQTRTIDPPDLLAAGGAARAVIPAGQRRFLATVALPESADGLVDLPGVPPLRCDCSCGHAPCAHVGALALALHRELGG